MRKNTASTACPTPPRRPSRSAEGLTVRTPLDVSMVICARASRILDSSKAAASALSALSNPAYRTMSGSDSASDWRASRIRGTFQKPTMPFSIQNRTRIVSRLQPKKSTPMRGIALARSRAIADRDVAVRRYRSKARPRESTVTAAAAPSSEAIVGRQGQELDEVVIEDEPVEQLGRVAETAGGLAAEGGELLVPNRAEAAGAEGPVVIERAGGGPPLPQLRARDLGGCRVLHEVVDRSGAVAAEPGVEVLQGDGDVEPRARLGGVPAFNPEVEQRRGVARDLGAERRFRHPPLALMRSGAEDAVEHLGGERHQVGMGDPRPVEPVR